MNTVEHIVGSVLLLIGGLIAGFVAGRLGAPDGWGVAEQEAVVTAMHICQTAQQAADQADAECRVRTMLAVRFTQKECH